MLMRRCLVCSSGLLLTACSGFAQTFNEPQCFFWGTPPTTSLSTYTFNPNHTYVKRVTQMSGFYGAEFQGGEDYSTDPVTRQVRNNTTDSSTGESGGFVCGKSAAYQVLHKVMYDTSTAAQKICIIIQDFGCDHPNDDYLTENDPLSGTLRYQEDSAHHAMPYPASASEYAYASDYDTRFFRAGDRLSWLFDSQFPDFARNQTQTDGSKKIADSGTGRTYRHPFVENGYPLAVDVASAISDGLDPGVLYPTPPLKVWMKDFIAGYKSVQLINHHIPDPDYFAFDTEAPIAVAEDMNGLFMLEKLFEDRSVSPTTAEPDHGYWNTKYVPGYDHKTLQDLFTEAQTTTYFAEYESPTEAGVSAHQHLVNLSDPKRAKSEANRAAARWWYQICQHVQEAVMQNCAYGPILAAFPSATVGNYNMVSTDGGVDNTSWMLQRSPVWTYNHDTITVGGVVKQLDRFRDISGAWQVSNSFPRVMVDGQWGGSLFYVNPPTSSSYDFSAQFLGYPSVALGNMNCPSLYGPTYGDATSNFQGFSLLQGLNFYTQNPTPGGGLEYPSENYWETTVRISRLNMESILNSFATTPGAGWQPPLVAPWVEMARTVVNGPIDHTMLMDTSGSDVADTCGSARTRAQLRDMLAMFRAKNVPVILPWTNEREGEKDPCYSDQSHAWRDTQLVIEQVYNSRIASYTRVAGTLPTGEVTTMDPSRLEFTLLDDQHLDRTVDLNSVGYSEAYTPGPISEYLFGNQTELVVDFTWTRPDQLGLTTGEGDAPLFDGQTAVSYYQVNLECSVTDSSTLGRVFAWCPDCASGGHGGWIEAKLLEPDAISAPTDSLYGFTAPQDIQTEASSPTRTHRTFKISSPSVAYYQASDGHYHSKLKFHQWSAGTFTSRYDLVQLIPVGYVATSTSPVAASDINGDGVIDSNDIEPFLYSYLYEVPIADLNADGVIDSADFEIFFADLGD